MREVYVIGAGVVGLTSAWYLAEAGWKVRLIDRAREVGTGTSYMNGGQLSYRYVSPLADSGIPFKAIRWLFERDGPLRFRPQATMDQWTWLAKFVLNCRRSVNHRTTLRLARLGQYSRTCMNGLITEHALPDFAWRESGKLVVYRNSSTFANAARNASEVSSQQVLNADECLNLEPAIANLHGHLAGGIYTPDEAVADCHAFCRILQKKLETHSNYLGLSVATAIRFEQLPGRRLRLVTDQGNIESSDVVLAAGAASRTLAGSAGVQLPIYPLKGYALDMPIHQGHVAPQTSVTDFEKKVLYARIGNRLRIAAMVDMVGSDEGIDASRIGTLLRIARRDMPKAGDYDHAQQWAGLRPATPGGAPIVGQSKIPGLWLNVGHGALGFTFACGTASTLASLMSKGCPPKELEGLDWLNS